MHFKNKKKFMEGKMNCPIIISPEYNSCILFFQEILKITLVNLTSSLTMNKLILNKYFHYNCMVEHCQLFPYMALTLEYN